MSYSIPYGKEKIHFDIPKNFSINIIKTKSILPINNIYEKTLNSITHPINSTSLTNLVKGKNSVCIVVTDITRKCPDKDLLIPIIEILEKEIKKENITILIASGMHKKMSLEEKIEKYGKSTCEKFKIIDHDASDDNNLTSLGITKSGNTIKISKIALEADLLISLGVVEPHQFAGYSGGYKTVSIGVADDKTISRTHSSKILKKSYLLHMKMENIKLKIVKYFKFCRLVI